MVHQIQIESVIGIGKIKFDSSVYRATQPIYTPVTTPTIIHHHGAPLDVNSTLASYSYIQKASSKNSVDSTLALVGKPPFNLPEFEIGEGGRNEVMLQYVGHLRGRGLKEQEIEVLALAINDAQFSPPLDENEVFDICSRYRHQNLRMSATLAALNPESKFGEDFDPQKGVVQISTEPPPSVAMFSLTKSLLEQCVCLVALVAYLKQCSPCKWRLQRPAAKI